jgi:hypothetical protein
MVVMHLENRDETRFALAELVGAKDGQVEGHTYYATAVFGAAEARLRSGTVNAFVLDLGLNPEWDNRNLPRALRQLTQGESPLENADAQSFYAYRLAQLAHDLGVPTVLLTNYPEQLGYEGPKHDALKTAFHAANVFRKDDDGLAACAAWVREQIGLEPRSRS